MKQKNLFTIGVTAIILVFIVVFVAGCGSAPATGRMANTPEWLNDLPPNDVIWGIGTAKQSSRSMSMTTAEARGRTAITRQLDTLVQAMFTDYNLDAGNVNNQANASLQEDVSRQVSSINLTGAHPIRRWEAPDGYWWFLVEYRKADARREVASILNNQEAAFAQFKAQQALQMLDAQLARNERPLQVSE
ncbi:MAG: LPP20 family lipoprotein [Spirochaetaceae bacterium]|nr:LPP20 family lipoprotein [Spirochaetaceae bacterium]